jgi:N utilization substance protein A
MRIQSIVNELGGEKIDVVAWSGDTGTFIGNALSPAKVSYVTLGDPDTNGKTATVIVPDDQLSLAIGKGGQNARLAAKLIGWRIDIKSSSEAQTEALKPQDLAAAAPTKDRDILAMAEAILLGKEQPPIEPELEPEGVLSEEAELVEAVAEGAEPVEAAVEEAAEPEASPILATAEALLQEQEPALAEAVADEAALELEAEAAEETVEELESTPVEEVVPEPEPEPAAAPAPVKAAPAAKREPRRPRYEYVKDERLEALTQADKKARRGRRRRLVRDEESGELIAQRKHKRDDDLDNVNWEEVDY